MARIDASITRGGNYPELVRQHYTRSVQAMERAALRATDRAANETKGFIRGSMQAANLGRLGNAIDSTSDLKLGRIKRYPNGGFSASGTLFVRTKSERTLGTLEAYTQGADIRPVRSRWLWFPTDEIQRLAGSRSQRQRVTPRNWKALGLESKIGPLVQIKSVNGNPLLVVRNVGVSAVGKARSARRLNRNGRPAKGQRAKEIVVAFIGIPRTSRVARIDIRQILEWARNDLPAMFEQEMRKEVPA